MMPRPDVEFDDILYRLQTDRGASVYWRQLTAEIARQRPNWSISRRPGRTLFRFAPVWTTARVFHSSLFRPGVGRDVKNVVTIHDLTYEKGLVPGRRAHVGLAQRRVAVRQADGLVFVSENTRREFVTYYPSATTTPSVVAWHGRDLAWDGGDDRGPDPSWALPGTPYLLHVGHRDGYKNFSAALAGYATSSMPGSGRPFVLLGPALSEEERTMIDKRGLSSLVVWRSAPDRDVLRRFLANALALVYVSREEGFGMPLIEAMQCRTPVIAAAASCLPEVAGGAALLVHPDAPDEIAAAIDSLDDSDECARWVTRGAQRATAFTWTASAATHLELYDRLR